MQDFLLTIILIQAFQTFLNFILILRTYDSYHESFQKLINNNTQIALSALDKLDYDYDSYDEEESDSDEEDDDTEVDDDGEVDGQVEVDDEVDDEVEVDDKQGDGESDGQDDDEEDNGGDNVQEEKTVN